MASGKFQNGFNHPRFKDPQHILSELKAKDLGTLEIVGDEVIPGKHRKVRAKCHSCDEIFLLLVDNISSCKTTNCRCQRGLKNGSTPGGKYYDPAAERLGNRFDAIKQRCSNPNYPQYEDYGGRGIENRFENRDHFIKWVSKNLPHASYKGVQIDRIENDGHYEPGNLRLVSQRQNLSNKRTSVKVCYKGQAVNAHHLWHLLKVDYQHFSLSKERTAKLATMNVPWEEILLRTPRGSYKGKVEVADPAVVALYKSVPP